MKSVYSIVPKEVNQEIIDVLQSALDKARAGEITTLVLLCGDAKGVDHSIKGITDRFVTAAYLFHAAHLMLHDTV